MSYWQYPTYVSVTEKKEKAAKKLKQLRKKNPDIKPIILEGRAIAKTWWGKSWNANLEQYADYSNRIGRGRSYVRHGSVLDLQISPGKINSLVQGSESRPYSVSIEIKAISKKIWQNIKTTCEGRLDSLQELLAGKFPRALGEIFTAKVEGLFPSPEEIEFNCTCPDWAYMCKHVAATLYGISVRLDEDPSLFFKLRKAGVSDLISQALQDKTKKLLKKAEKKSRRVIADSNLSDLFGIEMEDNQNLVIKDTGIKKDSTSKPGRVTSQKSRSKKQPAKPKMKTIEKIRPAKNKSASATDADQVLNLIKRSKRGIDVPALKKKTGFSDAKIRNIIYLAFKKGTIKRVSRGVYL